MTENRHSRSAARREPNRMKVNRRKRVLSHTWHAVKSFSGSDGKPTTCRGVSSRVSNRTVTERTRNNASNLLAHRNYHAAGYKSSVNPSFTNEVSWFAIVPCTKGFGQKLHEINIVWIEYLTQGGRWNHRNHDNDRLIQKILLSLHFIFILIIDKYIYVYNNKYDNKYFHNKFSNIIDMKINKYGNLWN